MTGGNGFEEAARGEGTEVPAGQDAVAAPEEVEEVAERFEEKHQDVFRALARGPVHQEEKEVL